MIMKDKKHTHTHTHAAASVNFDDGVDFFNEPETGEKANAT